MSNIIESIVISTEGIDVISNMNGVNSVTRLSLEEQEDERKAIFEKNNLSNLPNFPFDIKIVRALADNEDQLKDYLETCRRANYSKGKIEMPDSIPEVVYNLKNLRNGFEDKKNDELRKNSQIELFKTAKETKRLLSGKVKLKMGVLDKAYFVIQELLQKNKNQKSIQALSSGVAGDNKVTNNEFRENLHDDKYTKSTNEVSEKYTMEVENSVEGKIEEEQDKESEEVVK